MKSSTFNFLVDTLYEELLMHPHKGELLKLMNEQVADDTWLQNFINSNYAYTMHYRDYISYGSNTYVAGAFSWSVS